MASGFTVYVTDHFVLVYNRGNGWAGGAGQILESIYELFQRSFRQAGFAVKSPTDRLIWLCFDDHAAFGDYAVRVDGRDMSWLDGYYSARTNRVAIVSAEKCDLRGAKQSSVDPIALHVNASDDHAPAEKGSDCRQALDVYRASHEAAHQLAFNTGLQKRGVMYPFWVSEGLATNFEADSLTVSGLARENPARSRRLAEAHAAGRLTPLGKFVVFTGLPVGDSERCHDLYAEAWGLFRFLFTTRREQLKAYLGQLAQLQPGWRDEQTLRDQFESAFGPVEKLRGPWERFLEALAGANAQQRRP